MALFRIYVERIDGPLNGEHPDSLCFRAKNHDDILEIARNTRHLCGMDPDETAALAVGLKLFSEVMLKHRRESPYAELLPHFRAFLDGFKAQVRASVALAAPNGGETCGGGIGGAEGRHRHGK